MPWFSGGELARGAAGLDPGAGHQHVDPAVPGQDLLSQGADGALVRDVAGPAVHRGAGPGGQPVRGGGAALWGPAGQHDGGAGLGQGGGDGQAEPGRAAGDHGDLPGPGPPRCGRAGWLVTAGLAGHTRHDRRTAAARARQMPVTLPAAGPGGAVQTAGERETRLLGASVSLSQQHAE
jgi:hypothetical protein